MNDSTIKLQGSIRPKPFLNCHLSDIKTDGRLMAFNDKYLIASLKNSGEIYISDPTPKDMDMQKETFFDEDKSNLLDIEFSPFNSDIFAYIKDSNFLVISSLNRDENNYSITSSATYFEGAYLLNFNSVALDLICLGSKNGKNGNITLIDCNNIKFGQKFNLNTDLTSVLWNPNGSLIGCISKPNIIQVLDPRQNRVIFNKEINQLSLNSKFDWIDNDSIVTIGAKNNEKYLLIWDIRNKEKPVSSSKMFLKSNSNSIAPYVNKDLKLIYTIGKGDTFIHAYEYKNGNIKKTYDYNTSEFGEFSILLNRKYLEKQKGEIDRFARFTKNEKIFYISFYSPTKTYDEALYPNIEYEEPQMTSEEWFNGEEIIPKRVHAKKPQDNTNNSQNLKYNYYRRRAVPNQSNNVKKESSNNNIIKDSLSKAPENKKNNNNQKIFLKQFLNANNNQTKNIRGNGYQPSTLENLNENIKINKIESGKREINQIKNIEFKNKFLGEKQIKVLKANLENYNKNVEAEKRLKSKGEKEISENKNNNFNNEILIKNQL